MYEQMDLDFLVVVVFVQVRTGSDGRAKELIFFPSKKRRVSKRIRRRQEQEEGCKRDKDDDEEEKVKEKDKDKVPAAILGHLRKFRIFFSSVQLFLKFSDFFWISNERILRENLEDFRGEG